MKQKIFFLVIISSLFFINCNTGNTVSKKNATSYDGNVIQLNTEDFKKIVFNFDKNKEWKYEGTKPAIIDFYADWCAPCRQLSPLVEEIAKDYAGKIIVYKVDSDKEKIMAQKMGISGLPTLLFIPVNGKPSVSMGLIPKESLVKAVNDVLLIK